VSQTEPIKSLQAFAENNEVTTGKFTIGDEKVPYFPGRENEDDGNMLIEELQKHNVFMRGDVSLVPAIISVEELS
jgi:hydroxyacylglutathione hydrolase